MPEQIEKFDPSILMQGVKDRIKSTFVSMIPDTQWETMVEKEIDAFFNQDQHIEVVRKNEYQEGSFHSIRFITLEVKSSPFRMLIWEHCTEMTLKIIRNKITEDYFKDNYPYELVDDEKMTKIISEAAPIAAVKFFQGLSQNMGNQLMEHIHNQSIR